MILSYKKHLDYSQFLFPFPSFSFAQLPWIPSRSTPSLFYLYFIFYDSFKKIPWIIPSSSSLSLSFFLPLSHPNANFPSSSLCSFPLRFHDVPSSYPHYPPLYPLPSSRRLPCANFFFHSNSPNSSPPRPLPPFRRLTSLLLNPSPRVPYLFPFPFFPFPRLPCLIPFPTFSYFPSAPLRLPLSQSLFPLVLPSSSP